MQQVNLYQFKEEVSDLIFPFEVIFKIVSIFFIFLILMFSVYFYDFVMTSANFHSYENKKTAMRKELAKLQKFVPTIDQKQKVTKEYADLNKKKERLQKMLYTLSKLQIQKTSGFSDYFRALSDKFFPGIWITEFDVRNNGILVTIKGEALDSAYVPEVLQKIGETKAFKGKLFQDLSMEASETENVISFSLGSS